MHFSHFLTSIHAIGAVYSCYASPVASRSSYAVAEHHPVPKGWKKVGPAPKSSVIKLQIGLKQANKGAVEQHLLQISDPTHARYGQYLSNEQLHSIITPSEETIGLVKTWLLENGITSFTYSPAKDWISTRLTVGQVEDLLQTEYYTFVHKDGTSVIRAPEWSLPADLHEHIDVVQPTTSFFRPDANAKSLVLGSEGHTVSWWEAHGQSFAAKTAGAVSDRSISSICNISFTTLECVRTLYGTIDYVAKVPEKQKIGVTNYLDETTNRADIELYLKNQRPDAISAAHTFELISVANGTVSQNYTNEDLLNGKGAEGILDAEWTIGVSYPIPMVAWSTGGEPPYIPDISTPRNTNEPYLAWLEYVLAQKELPTVITTSYGDSEQTVPYSYAQRVCEGFAQLGARGISVLFSSGDAGVGSANTCVSNDGNKTIKFLPDFPTSCPYITSVGATEAFEPEVAVKRFASGAGFSNYFAAPDYQKKTVDDYVKSLNGLHDGLYNKSGRAYPDVAAQGNRDVIVYNNKVRLIGGTSASVPTFSAIISLVNDALLADGKPVLGFLNPWLYQVGYKGLNDIVGGSSFGCNTTGFPAQVGWDAVTGWGTPNFPKLKQLALEKSNVSRSYRF
ncbi:tripeptidyl-peptidase I [Venturia nashicola]|uniref:tripeptidyl-peptidase II n=1 Tax=Venturia nashicola TaxID=86259 RepID=A0A4Z1NRF8_9PEZI|nr:tripeptidyl-peptidase I [Venturia nashicola]TLD29390.1 tripeptidyl-peptidase I [Venturia nashicola]